MKHVEENTTVADASTYQKSEEVTSCREAATIGSEPSKKQRSEPKLKERIRLLDARQELQKEQQSDHQQRHGLGKRFLLLQHLALSQGESGNRNRWKLTRRSPEHQNEQGFSKPKGSMHLSHNAAGRGDRGGQAILVSSGACR